MTRHPTPNGGMFFPKNTPDLMQSLPCFPTTPHVQFLPAKSPNRLPCFINTTFENGFIPDGVVMDGLIVLKMKAINSEGVDIRVNRFRSTHEAKKNVRRYVIGVRTLPLLRLSHCLALDKRNKNI